MRPSDGVDDRDVEGPLGNQYWMVPPGKRPSSRRRKDAAPLPSLARRTTIRLARFHPRLSCLSGEWYSLLDTTTPVTAIERVAYTATIVVVAFLLASAKPVFTAANDNDCVVQWATRTKRSFGAPTSEEPAIAKTIVIFLAFQPRAWRGRRLGRI